MFSSPLAVALALASPGRTAVLPGTEGPAMSVPAAWLRVSALVGVLAASGCVAEHRTAETATPPPRAPATILSQRATPSPIAAATVVASQAAAAMHAAVASPVAVASPAHARPRTRATTVASPRANVASVHETLPTPAAADPRPYILSASVSPAVVSSGTTVSADVRTTAGVASVVAYAGGTSMAVPRVGIGRFAGSTTLPDLPSFVHGVFPVTFVAHDRSGRSTQTAISVTVP
jgi:hypothetical protein